MASITRPLLKRLRAKIDEALAEIGKEHDLHLKTGSASFRDQNFTMKIEGATLTEDGEVASPEREEYTLYAKMLDLDPEWLDQEFQMNGETYKVTGLKLRRRKYPVSVKRSDGKGYRMTADQIKFGMSRKTGT